MVVISIPKQVTENEEELKSRLVSLILNFAHEKGVPLLFIEDSQAIQESIDTITSRTANLIYTVKLEKEEKA